MQAGQQHNGWRLGGVGDLELVATEHVDEFFVDGLNDLLAWRKRLAVFDADKSGFDLVDECAGNLDVDVGLEKRHSDFA